jgi:translation initiation factor IF-2
MEPVSERGKRRAKKREESGPKTMALQFKDGRPESPITLTEGMTVRDFSDKLGVKAKDLMKALFSRGIMASINHVLDTKVALELAEEVGVEAMEVSFEEEVQLQHEFDGGNNEDAEKVGRPPVVTVMGHVDHGKTSLLDAIRSTKVADGEAGGITQHIGAYQVEVKGKKIVFLDTPGHEAFTLMRARGAKVTDIIILVVAADDGVMPQTLEAIDHAKAAKVPLIVAINKIDKANANLDRVKKDLADKGLMVEDWGGDTVAVPISALQRKGIDELLEMVLLTTELLELKAAPSLPGQGAVLEARKEIGRGIIATLLVQDGTVNVGDIFVAGATWGRVRSMVNDDGTRVENATPATPVEVTGFNNVPGAGDTFQIVENEAKARSIAEFRQREDRQRELAATPGRLSLEQLFQQIDKGECKELPVIIKADVHGSVEVVRDTLQKLSTDKVEINVIHTAVGAITTNDVILASASNAIVVGFNVRPERIAKSLADKEQVEIRLHTVIYELADELKKAMAGLLEPVFKEVIKGSAEIREIFRVPKIGVVAGCHVVDGLIPRSASARVLRDNVVVYEGKLASLRRFKDDTAEVRSGFDCGIGLENFQDFKPGDVIESYVREEIAAEL